MSEALLRERIDYLEAEVHRLNSLLGAAADDETLAKVRTVLGVKAGVARLLLVLLAGQPGRMWNREALHHGYCRDELDPPHLQIVDVQMVHLRKALKTHEITIETVWGVGYRLAPDMRAKVEALLS